MTEERKKPGLFDADKYKSNPIARKILEKARISREKIDVSELDQEKLALVRKFFGDTYPEDYKFFPRELDRLAREIRLFKLPKKTLQNYDNKKSRGTVAYGRQFSPPSDKDLLRDGRNGNDVPLREPVPLEKPDAKERLTLEDIDNQTLAAHVVQREATDAAFAGMLKAARTARHAFDEAAKPAIPLPTVAPKLWADRTAEDPDNASDFIRVIYADWLPNVLARQDLRNLDYDLYDAYAQRIRSGSKHKDDKVEFAPKRHRRDRLSDEEAGARRHASADAYNAKLKPS